MTPTTAVEAAQVGAAVKEGTLSQPVQETLSRLQDQWLQWDSAFGQGDQERAEAAINDMLATAAELGMSRLPDFCLGIQVRAVAAGEDGASSLWAMDMAEQLDPGRSETAFARSRLAATNSSYVQAMSFVILGYLRLVGEERHWSLWLQDLLLWSLATLLLTASLFIVLQMATKGADLYRGLTGFLGRFVPTPLAHLLTLAVLGWPLLATRGWIWIVLYWLALLWGQGSASERRTLVFVCVVIGLAPILIDGQHQTARVSLSDEMRVVENLSQERLYGGLFRDLGLLRTTLPDSHAVDQLISDVHSNLGQGHLAIPGYLRVIEAEPQNHSALVNLGVHHFHRKEYVRAIERFRQAAEVEPTDATAFYNLSLTYRTLLELEEADNYLEQARLTNSAAVREWVAQSRPVITLNGGFKRRREIRDEILSAWRGEAAGPLWRRVLEKAPSASPALCALILALFLQLLRKNLGSVPPPTHILPRPDGGWTGVFVPGFVSALAGDGMRAFLALLIPVAAVLLPIGGVLAYRMPWGFDPGRLLTWGLAGTVLLLYMGVRIGTRLRQAWVRSQI